MRAPDTRCGVERTHRARAGGALGGAGRSLEVEDARVRFGGLQALAGVSLTVDGRVDRRPHRTERRRQDDAVQRDQRPAAASTAGASGSTGATSPACPPAARAARGIGRSFQNLGLMMDETRDRNVLAAQHLGAGYTDLDLAARPWRWRRCRAAHRGPRRRRPAGLRARRRPRPARRRPVVRSRPVRRAGRGARRGAVARAARRADDRARRRRDRPAPGGRAGAPGRGTTVLVIAHDVGFVMDCATTCTSSPRARCSPTGRPTTVQHDPAVVEAYLGVPA